MSEQITELESQLAFQDRTIQQLNETVIQQQKDIDRLSAAVAMLVNQLQQLHEMVGVIETDDKPPPHY